MEECICIRVQGGIYLEYPGSMRNISGVSGFKEEYICNRVQGGIYMEYQGSRRNISGVSGFKYRNISVSGFKEK